MKFGLLVMLLGFVLFSIGTWYGLEDFVDQDAGELFWMFVGVYGGAILAGVGCMMAVVAYLLGRR